LRRRLGEIVRRRLMSRLAPIDLVVKPRSNAYQSSFRDLAADFDQWLAFSSDRSSGQGVLLSH
jgi:RNase P protein component